MLTIANRTIGRNNGGRRASRSLSSQPFNPRPATFAPLVRSTCRNADIGIPDEPKRLPDLIVWDAYPDDINRRPNDTWDGVVVGFIVRPVAAQAAPYPVIVFNRGGLLDIGKITEANLVDFHDLASQGFIVVASQYRGNDVAKVEKSLAVRMSMMYSQYAISLLRCPMPTTRTYFYTVSHAEG